MSVTVSREEILHLAKLARLELSEDEIARFAPQLSEVMSYVAQLQSVETSNLDASQGVSHLDNVLAEDVPRSETDLAKLDRDQALDLAPLRAGDFIQVRAVMGGEVDPA